MKAARVLIKFVQGHQDKDILFVDLPFESQLNVTMDENAKKLLSTTARPTPPPPHYKGQLLSISMQNNALVNNIESSLIDNFQTQHWTAHMKKNFNITKHNMSNIDWTALGRYHKKNINSLGSIMKLTHNQINTFVKRNKWNENDTPLCPLCNSEPETFQHILQCDHPIMAHTKATEILKLETSLKKFGTSPSIIQLILFNVCNLSKIQMPHSTYINAIHPQIQQSQNQISWTNFLKGFISNTFAQTQQQFHDNLPTHNKKPFCIQNWSYKLTSSILQYTRSLWNMRCNVLHLENTQTLEARTRTEAIELHKSHKCKWWNLHNKDRELLERDSHFFKKGPITSVEFWLTQIKFAQQRITKRKRPEKDIRSYLSIKKQRQFKKNKNHLRNAQAMKTSNQTSILKFSNAITHSSTSYNDHNTQHKYPEPNFSQSKKRPSTYDTSNNKIFKWLSKYKVRKK